MDTTEDGAGSSGGGGGGPHAMVIDSNNNNDNAEHGEGSQQAQQQDRPHSSPRSKSGWDGKLRVEKKNKPVIVNPEALSDPEYSDEDAPPADVIEADEGEG